MYLGLNVADLHWFCITTKSSIVMVVHAWTKFLHSGRCPEPEQRVAELSGKAAFHPSVACRLYRNKLLVLEARRKLKRMSKPSGVPLAGTSPACGMPRGKSGISFKVHGWAQLAHLPPGYFPDWFWDPHKHFWFSNFQIVCLLDAFASSRGSLGGCASPKTQGDQRL